MAERHKVKVTVLRRFTPSEVFETSPVTLLDLGLEKGKPTRGTWLKACEVFRENQEFIVEDGNMPRGFCTSAWQTLYCNYRTLAYGGTFPFRGNIAINCCTDGLRPVVFKLERI